MLGAEQRMFYASRRMAGSFDHHVDLVAADHCRRVIGELGGVEPGLIPANLPATCHRSGRIEIGDNGNHEARGRRYLRQEHGAEFAGADQSCSDWLLVGFVLQ